MSVPGPKDLLVRLHELPFAPSGVPVRLAGREALRQAMAAQEAAPSRVRYDGFDQVEIWETTDPEVVLAEYDICGTVTATGAPFRLRQVLLLRARAGEIVLTRGYLNPAALAAVLSPT